MIDFAKCQTCYPVVAKIIEIKFEGEKAPRQCIMRSWRECDKDATVHVVDYVDPKKPSTRFVLHRCAEHAAPEPKPQVEPEVMRDCFGGTS
jgi:hypothetical protein